MVLFKQQMRLWIVGLGMVGLLLVAGYIWEVNHYDDGIQNHELVMRWQQHAQIAQDRTDVNKKLRHTRNIFIQSDKVARAKRNAIKKKAIQKKKLARHKPVPIPVMDTASRLRCLAVARRGQQWTAYMTLDEQVHLVKPGDVINKQVRILEIGEKGVRIEDIKAGRRSLVPVLGV